MNITININDEILAEAKALAKYKGTTINAIARKAVADFVESEKRKQEIKLGLDALKAISGKIKFDHIPTREEMNER